MSTERGELVILGTGFAATRLVKSIDPRHYHVTVVSPRNYFLFTPLLASTTVGTIEFRSIIEPIRAANEEIRYFQASCIAIHANQKTISCRSAVSDQRFDLPYEQLVIAVGAVSNTYNIPGVREHCLFLKDLADARAIRQAIIERFEKASIPGTSKEEITRLLHFVVVGGGPTGVELAAELHDFLVHDLKQWFGPLTGEAQITILEGLDKLLSTFDQRLGEYTARAFRRSRIEVRTGAFVREIRSNEAVLRDGTIIPFGLAIWSTGIGPTELAQESKLPKDEQARFRTDEYLRVNGFENIYALGDCAVVFNRNYPFTAQLAQQQGKYLAKSLNRRARGRPAKPFRYFHMGMLAYIGSQRALADLPGIKARGFVAWLLWRSVYLTKLVSLKNKVLVLFDWFKTSVFGRDISKF